jgi:hypothetical protein
MDAWGICASLCDECVLLLLLLLLLLTGLDGVCIGIVQYSYGRLKQGTGRRRRRRERTKGINSNPAYKAIKGASQRGERSEMHLFSALQ